MTLVVVTLTGSLINESLKTVFAEENKLYSKLMELIDSSILFDTIIEL